MATRHDSHNQPPSWGHHRAPAPSSLPNASAGPSTHHFPLAHQPPVSQEYPPPASHPHSTSRGQQSGVGVFPSSSSGCYALPLGSQKMLHKPPAGKFVSRQQVMARITTDAWVMGIIVGALHVCSKFTGLKYNVKFESVEGSGQYETREFSAEDLSPYWPREQGYPNVSR